MKGVTMDPQVLDHRIRLAAFSFLERCMAQHGDAVPRQVLAPGFEFEGQRVPLVSPQGIFKPAVLPDVPLTITTVPLVEGKERPYDDEMSSDGFLVYKYRCYVARPLARNTGPVAFFLAHAL